MPLFGMKILASRKRILLNVRELAKSPFSVLGAGISGGRDARSLIGIRVHQEVAAESPDQEVSISHDFTIGEWTVRVTGRMDALDTTSDPVRVKEIKTRFSAFNSREPAPRPEELRQLECYLVILSIQQQEKDFVGELIEVHAASGQRRVSRVTAPDAETWIDTHVACWVEWLEAILASRERRRRLSITFPHPTERHEQIDMRKAVEHAYEAGESLLLSAPTGTGKTAAVLTEALRLAAAEGCQLLWLTAKTPQQALPMALAASMSKELRTVCFAAKERCCINEVFAFLLLS